MILTDMVGKSMVYENLNKVRVVKEELPKKKKKKANKSDILGIGS